MVQATIRIGDIMSFIGLSEAARQWAIALVAIFIIMDVISGFIKGAAQHNLSSSAIRQGIWHKAAYIILMALAVLIDLAQNHLDLGFNKQILIPLCIMIILSEAVSIVENVIAIFPELKDQPILKLFNTSAADDTIVTRYVEATKNNKKEDDSNA
jgi:toxin secretion/phage lysis holin